MLPAPGGSWRGSQGQQSPSCTVQGLWPGLSGTTGLIHPTRAGVKAAFLGTGAGLTRRAHLSLNQTLLFFIFFFPSSYREPSCWRCCVNGSEQGQCCVRSSTALLISPFLVWTRRRSVVFSTFGIASTQGRLWDNIISQDKQGRAQSLHSLCLLHHVAYHKNIISW